MDSGTQLILGAAVGYAVGGRVWGKKAMLWGAIAGILPDLDFVPILPFKEDPFIYLKHHRGFSHSLIFCLVAPVALAWPFKKKLSSDRFNTLFWIFLWGIATHILLDCFTTWGTQTLWPLAHRTSWNSVFIIDPLYSTPLLISVAAALVIQRHATRHRAIVVGVTLSSLYLVWTVGVKLVLAPRFQALFEQQGVKIERFTSRPTPFNSILWSATAETEEGYFYGMISLLDRNREDRLYFVSKNHHLTDGFTDEKSQELIAYTKNYYRVERIDNGIIIHDLRYGFLGDPRINEEQYVFSYRLTKDAVGKVTLEVVNPRPTQPNRLLRQLWQRLKGI